MINGTKGFLVWIAQTIHQAYHSSDVDAPSWRECRKTVCDAIRKHLEGVSVETRKFGPKTADHPTIGTTCPACGVPFKEGDYTTLVALGPGDDKEAQEKAREGRVYNAVAVEVHFTCVTGGV